MATEKRIDPTKMYDISPEEMKVIQERARIRDDLKKEFLKKVTDPYARQHKGYVVSVKSSKNSIRFQT